MPIQSLFMRLAMLLPLVLPTAAYPQTAGVSGSELMDDCANYPDSKRPRNCELFATAFAEFARSNDKTENPRGRLCIGGDVPASEIIGLINDWLAKHPNAGSMNGYEIAYNATRDRYRCR